MTTSPQVGSSREQRVSATEMTQRCVNPTRPEKTERYLTHREADNRNGGHGRRTYGNRYRMNRSSMPSVNSRVYLSASACIIPQDGYLSLWRQHRLEFTVPIGISDYFSASSCI